MERVTDLKSLVGHLGPVVYAPDRLAALERAGIEVDPAISSEVRQALAADVLGLPGRLSAAAASGPSVPITVSADAPRVARAGDRPRTVEGFDVVATVFLRSVQDIVAKLWEGLVYPQDLPATKLFDADALRAFFLGVPDGAQVGAMRFPEPPTLHVVASDVVALVQPLRLELDAPGGAVELVATATVDVPVVLQVTNDEIRLEPTEITQRTALAFAVDPGSALQPRDGGSLAAFSASIVAKVAGGIVVGLDGLKRSRVFDVPGGVGDGKLRVRSMALWLQPWTHGDVVTVGAVVEQASGEVDDRDPPPREGLARFRDLFPPNTIWVVASESLVEQGLRALVDSGEISDRISEKLHWLSFFSLSSRVEARDARVRIEDGAVVVELDCVHKDICAFRADFGFRATVALRPEVVNGDLRLPSDGIDVNLDNLDAVLCALTSPLTGPFGLIALTVGAVIAAFGSTSFNKKTPGFWQGERLPNGDVFPRVDLVAAGRPQGGLLDLFGHWYLAPDELSTFVVAQVLEVHEATGEAGVVEGATVGLLELDAPAPAGDDFVPPKDTVSEREEPDGTRVRVATTYTGPSADHLVAAAATEQHGLAHLAGVLDDTGGSLHITTTTFTPGGAGFTLRRREAAHGDAPDLAVTVTLPDGFQPVRRQPIALNLAERRLGTVQEPVRLAYVNRCVAERHALAAAEAAVKVVTDRLAELQTEHDQLPPSEQGPIERLIRKIQDEQLRPATAALAAARAAREDCERSG